MALLVKDNNKSGEVKEKTNQNLMIATSESRNRGLGYAQHWSRAGVFAKLNNKFDMKLQLSREIIETVEWSEFYMIKKSLLVLLFNKLNSADKKPNGQSKGMNKFLTVTPSKTPMEIIDLISIFAITVFETCYQCECEILYLKQEKVATIKQIEGPNNQRYNCYFCSTCAQTRTD